MNSGEQPFEYRGVKQEGEAARHAACIGRTQQWRREVNEQGPKRSINAPVNAHHDTITEAERICCQWKGAGA